MLATDHTFSYLNRTVHSTDSDLVSLIDRIKQDIPEVSDIQTLDQALTYASTFSAIHVGEALLKQTAVLLPSIYEVFRNKVMEITQLRGIMISRDICLLYTSPSPRDATLSRMPSSA